MRGLAERTGAVKVDIVGDVGEVMLATQPAGVFLDVDRGEGDGCAALPAQQIMTMARLRAEAVEDLAVLRALCLGDPVCCQRAQDAVHAGQADPELPLLANVLIKLLGAAKVLLRTQHL